MNAGSFGRTIQLFLVDGTPSGLRKATLHGWTGLVYVAGNSAFGAMTARDEVDRSGVYVLWGPDPEQPGETRAYIGSANSVASRIKQSAEKRDFWETAIAVTTSDDDLSKGHAEYLEARLIELAVQAGRVTLDNATQPDTGKRRLPEADRANMEQFLANLRIVLPITGLEMLKPQPRAVAQKKDVLSAPASAEAVFVIAHGTGVTAKASEEDGEFIVLEGSGALTDTGYKYNYTAAQKRKLVEDGVLVPDGPKRLRFAKPWSFSSPSAAAAVVLDRNANGRTEWKHEASGKTYHQWQEAQAKAQETADETT